METPKKKYAFIDVQNTESTTRKLLGFIIDWKKLFQFLKNSWGCEKVFFYASNEKPRAFSPRDEVISDVCKRTADERSLYYKNRTTWSGSIFMPKALIPRA